MKTAVRRVLLLSALLSPSALYALGLGEIRLNSALNQPFDAEIELVSAAQEDLAALQASLASSDTFVRYGLDKPAYLSDFVFRVSRTDGRDVLRVTSPRPVTEPFVTLLVEASWPRGRLLREYTVLLDPPVFSPTPAASAAPVAAPRSSAPTVATTPERSVPAAPAPTTEPRAVRPVAVAASIEPGSTYRVQPNDTLWKIASAANPGTRSEVNRAMVAIFEANPDAFAGNINVLRAGSELRIPGSGDIAAISASAAASEVARQYRMWREGSAAPVDAAADGGRLRLVTPEQGSPAPSTATTTPATAAGDPGLQSRVQQLENELAEARRLLEVRNAELATLQGSAPVEGAEPAPATPTDEVPVEPGPDTEAAPVVEAPADGMATEPEAAEPPAVVEPEPAPEPTSTVAEDASPTLFERLASYWWVLLGLLLAAFGITALLKRRRGAAASEDSLEEALGRAARDDLRSRPTISPRARDGDILVEERQPAEPAIARDDAAVGAGRPAEPSRRPGAFGDTLSGEGPMSTEAGDPLAEADFHMAYGLYDQAADLVQVASKREPARRDLKLKLLEIYFVWGNREQFLALAREMNATRVEAQPGEWDKILIMGKQIAQGDPLFAGDARQAGGSSVDLELQASDGSIDIDLLGGDGPEPDLDFTSKEQRLNVQGGLDFVIDEPFRGADEQAGSTTVSTVKTARLEPGQMDDPTAELPIEDLAIDVGNVGGLDEIDQLEDMLAARPRAVVEDTVERPTIARTAAEEFDEDLLSSTSLTRILPADLPSPDDTGIEREAGFIDLSDATGEVPTIESRRLDVTGELPTIQAPRLDATSEMPTVESPRLEATGELPTIQSPRLEATGELPTIQSPRLEATSEMPTIQAPQLDATGQQPTLEMDRLEATGMMPAPGFVDGDGEVATMSEVGTKLDLARAYIDMGDPEGARSILDEVLKEGSATQKREAERLLASLP